MIVLLPVENVTGGYSECGSSLQIGLRPFLSITICTFLLLYSDVLMSLVGLKQVFSAHWRRWVQHSNGGQLKVKILILVRNR